MQKTFPLLSALALSSALAAQCVPASGTAVTLTRDSIVGPLPIGFAFPFAGNTYTDVNLSDHGLCYLSNGTTPAMPAPLPLVYTPEAAALVLHGPVIAPFWSDTVTATVATSTFTIESQPSVCTITWTDVESFGFPAQLMTFQLRLHSTGNIEFVYDPRVNNNSNFGGVSDNGVVGVSEGAPASLPSPVDLRSSPVSATNTMYETWTTALTFDMPGDAVLLVPTNPGWVVVHAPGGSGCASHARYGTGCHGLVLDSNDPVVGATWSLTTSGIDPLSAFAFTYFAFDAQNPAVPLSAFGLGAPGCFGHINPLPITLNGTNTGGTATVGLAIPGGPSIVGLMIFGQSIALTTANPAGVATSNGIRGTAGN